MPKFYKNMAIIMPTSNCDGEILTIRQVAGYLKVTERTIYRLAAAKQIPAFKVGGSWRFLRTDIDSWIKRQSSGGREYDDAADLSENGE